ncbi:MAG: hypothetical protein JSS32_05575 [Verrucomicrobia bacterium]|nr:hypothetical protein [Verrucomicrobiota bacterium]
MKKRIAIYLAGSIKKGHENPNESFWTEADIQLIRDSLKQFDVAMFNPAFRSDDLSDQKSVFGRDMLQVFSSHAVFADVRDRRGLGVGAEMMWAKINRIPVVGWAPIDTHYHKKEATILGVPVKNYVHPFVEGLCDCIAKTLPEAAQWLEKHLSSPAKVKGIEDIGSCMEHYKASQLHKDLPMKQLMGIQDDLTKRMNRPIPEILGG